MAASSGKFSIVFLTCRVLRCNRIYMATWPLHRVALLWSSRPSSNSARKFRFFFTSFVFLFFGLAELRQVMVAMTQGLDDDKLEIRAKCHQQALIANTMSNSPEAHCQKLSIFPYKAIDRNREDRISPCRYIADSDHQSTSNYPEIF